MNAEPQTPQSLAGFVRYFLGLNFGVLRAVAFYDYGSVVSYVIYRGGRFQAEFFSLQPGPGFPRQHRHPDVDSVEFILSRHVPLIINSADVSGLDGCGGRLGIAMPEAADSVNAGTLYPVLSTDWHGVGDVPDGGAFISLQEWMNAREPTSVGLNWEGTPVSLKHRAMLRQPGAVWLRTRKTMEPSDA